MGKLMGWLAFEAIPRAIERSPVRRLPYPMRVAVAIPILIALLAVIVGLLRLPPA
jgi:hypothetical protein